MTTKTYDEIVDELYAVEAQRDELLAALLDIRANVRFAREHSTNKGLRELATIVEGKTEIAKRAAIARAEQPTKGQ